jgi:hypothetical protein
MIQMVTDERIDLTECAGGEDEGEEERGDPGSDHGAPPKLAQRGFC